MITGASDQDPMRRPGDLEREPRPARPHDPRKRRGRSNVERPSDADRPRDAQRPAGDERVGQRDDDVVRPDADPRAPMPGLPHPGPAPAAD